MVFALSACAHHAPRMHAAFDALSWLIGEWHGTRLEPSTGEKFSVTSKIRQGYFSMERRFIILRRPNAVTWRDFAAAETFQLC